MSVDRHGGRDSGGMEPMRWRDDEALAPAVRRFVQSVRAPQLARPSDLARLEAAVRHITAAPERRAWFGWRFIAAAAAVVVTFSALGVSYALWRTQQVERPSVLPDRTVAPASLPRAARPPILATAEAELPTRSSTAPAPARVHRHPVVRATAEPTVDSLDRETSLISLARAAVATAPGDALALLLRHRQAFPDGQLGAERELLTVEALVRLRRLPEARARAAALSSHYPTSSYSARAIRLLREDPSVGGIQTSDRMSADAAPSRAP